MFVTPVELLLFLSVAVNVGLLFRLKRSPKRTESIELKEFLADLLSGPAMIAIARVDPNDVLLRSPKQR